MQFWSEIILVISNRTRAVRSFDFEITRMISDQIALHSVQNPIMNCTPLGTITNIFQEEDHGSKHQTAAFTQLTCTCNRE